jgi:hypothetical protein
MRAFNDGKLAHMMPTLVSITLHIAVFLLSLDVLMETRKYSRMALITQTLLLEISRCSHGFTFEQSNLQSSQRKDQHQGNLLAYRHVELSEYRHWHNDQDEIENHVDGGVEEPRSIAVLAMV